jgi:hypothetical protein
MFHREQFSYSMRGYSFVRMTRALFHSLVLSALVTAVFPLGAQTAAQSQTAGRQLTDRRDDVVDPDTEVDAQITSRVTVPTEAEGWYTMGREGESVEVDFEPRGLTGYLVMLGDAKTDKRAPLTFFFAKTRSGGDNIYFATHEIHRSWYEFAGVVAQSPPREKTLEVEYSLVGTLTLHRLEADGTDSSKSRRVKFKKMR